ncbi:hypothetical protein MSI_13280 [Treponema sp. JC4]|uniref:hypothetical protein n=1 Tax=Treponema sp. JC4 TaxID=1124982 RepID=UPI00025B0DFF|nr:hypothetical protein [Treponema sp. JC4]EID85203.1 hypothetical protein MSI_13280 [Treponema sp. JC4]
MKKYRLFFAAFLIFSALYLLSCNNTFDESSSKNDSSDSEFGIKYSFYLDDCTDQTWTVICGEEGSILPTITKPEKHGYRFTNWITKDKETLPAVFGSEKLSFYAQWEDSTKLIGSKIAPDTVGDVIFTDGSASPYPENWSDLTDDQWNAAVAMLFTTTYNPNNGQNEKGGQYQYKLAAGLVVAASKQWCGQDFKDNVSYEPKGSPMSYNWDSSLYKFRLWNSIYIGYSWNKNAYKTKTVLPQLSLSNYFGRQNLVDSSIFKTYADEKSAAAFYYAIQYGKSQKIISDFKDDWYLPSGSELKILLQDEELKQKYKKLLVKKYSVLDDTLKSEMLSDIKTDTVFWSSSTGSQEVNSKEYIAHGSNIKGSNFNEEKVYWGTYDENPPSTHEIWLWDPYTGFEGRPIVSINPAYGYYGKNADFAKGEALFRQEDCNTTYIDDKETYGYAYKTAFYTKAYKLDYQGYISYDEKLNEHAVIPIRVY